MYVIHDGRIVSGFQFASGQAVDRATNPSPFSAGTLRLQAAQFAARGFDLGSEIPGLYWGTINVELGRDLRLMMADHTFPDVDWTASEARRIAPETFSFVRCCLAIDGSYHPGYLYYPHPETKPSTNEHRYNVLEVLTHHVPGATNGRAAAVICRADAFAPMEG